jgi:hypothetical protein
MWPASAVLGTAVDLGSAAESTGVLVRNLTGYGSGSGWTNAGW